MKLTNPILTALLMLSAFVSVGRSDDKPSPNDFLIIPGVRAGLIGLESREAYLRKVLGPDLVRSANVSLADGSMRSGTLLFPDDPTRRVEILWMDKASRRRPEMVIISSSATAWHTAENITIGTRLSQIESLNGRPVHLTGFGLDNAGTITGGNRGRLSYLGIDKGEEGVFGRLLLIRLGNTAAAWDALNPRERKSVSGDAIVLSSLPAIRKLGPGVVQIIVHFTHP